MSNTALAKAHKQVQSLREAYARKRKEEKSSVRSVTHKVVSGGSAFALAYYDARYPANAAVMGVPIALAIGGAAALAELMGWGGMESDIVGAAGQGALDCFAAQKGAEMGANAKAAAGQ